MRLRCWGPVDPPEEVTSRPGPTAMTGRNPGPEEAQDSLKEKPKKFRTRRVKQVLSLPEDAEGAAGIDEHGVGNPDEFGLNDTFLDAGTSAIENRELSST